MRFNFYRCTKHEQTEDREIMEFAKTARSFESVTDLVEYLLPELPPNPHVTFSEGIQCYEGMHLVLCGERVLGVTDIVPTESPQERRNRLVARLRELAGYQWHHTPGDPEDWHIEADNILLEMIGDEEVRELFEKIEKWYS
jgi:hypothetical protein